jgi:hypothetical protein
MDLSPRAVARIALDLNSLHVECQKMKAIFVPEMSLLWLSERVQSS